MEKTLAKLEKRALTEQVRYENSVERTRLATDNIRKIRSGEWRSLKDKYREKARTFAEYVKDDIIDRGMTGSLPVQNLPLKESTIRKRLGVGLNATRKVFGIPVVGYRKADGSYLENDQLEPDVHVLNDPATIVKGEDTQLRVAVETLMKDLGLK